MNKRLFYYLFAVLCTVTLFTSCSDDDGPGDDGDVKKVLMENAIGTYSGELNVSLEGAPFDPITQKIFVEQESSDKVKLSLRNFSIEVGGAPFVVGDIEIGGIVLEGDANSIVLPQTSVTMQHESLGELKITLSSGNIVNGKAVLRIDVVQVALELNILVNFEGNRISTEVDKTDYAKELAGWYAQESINAVGQPDDYEIYFPGSLGVTFSYAGYNKINLDELCLSFPPNSQKVVIKDLEVEKKADGSITIAEVKQSIADTQNKEKELELIFSGNVKDGNITLNVSLKSEQYDISYVFVGKKTLTGNSIESITIGGDVVKAQPEIQEKEIVFYVKNGTTAKERVLVPVFTISEGSTLKYNDAEYVAGTPIDFSIEQQFSVVSQKGTPKIYTISCKEWSSFDTNLDKWELQFDSDKENMKFYGPVDGWSSSNGGVEYIKRMGPLLALMAESNLYPADKPYPVLQTDNAKSGSAASLTTLDTKGVPSIAGFPAVPKVTSGSLFNGAFVVNTDNTLASTRFGDPCDKEPKFFTGSYKYTPGETYYKAKYPGDTKRANEVEVADIKDTPAMNAVLYEADTYAFDYLDGTNLLTSEKIVAIASVTYDEAAESGYIDFNVPFVFGKNKSFDATKKYKLAIVCSSSKDGDSFSGAPGSVLLVDDLKIVF